MRFPLINRKLALPLILIFSFLYPSCSWFRVKQVRRIPASERALPAKTATLDELELRVNNIAENTNTLKLNVLYQLSGGSTSAGEIADYRETEGFILLKKPAFIRLIGLAFKLKVFDMVSDGKDFHIYIPPKNKYIFGFNTQEIKPRKDIPVNLRPQHVFSALLIEPLNLNLDYERISFEEDEEGRRKFYVLMVMEEAVKGKLVLERKLWIDRFDLRLTRQKYFDKQGKILTDVIYSNYQNIQGKDYPAVIDFRRPQDQYSLRIRVNKASINENLKDDQFVLEQPEGSELLDLSKELVAR